MTDIDALIAAIRDYKQADEEGIMVLVSRQACDEAIAALAAQQARIAELDALATRSTRRLVELSEPGSIGAFAARDMAVERATKAEAEIIERRAVEADLLERKNIAVRERDAARAEVAALRADDRA